MSSRSQGALPRSYTRQVAGQFDELTAALEAFVAERDWQQFHTPKNLAMALAGEVGELIEHFQWLGARGCFAWSVDEETNDYLRQSAWLAD